MQKPFFEAYQDAKSFRRDMMLVLPMVLVGGAVLTLWFVQGSHEVFTIYTKVTLIVWSLMCVAGWFFQAIVYEIIGKEGVITVIDGKTFLMPGESLRLWRYPTLVHTISLQSISSTTYDIDDLKYFRFLADHIIDCDVSDPSTKALRVTVKYKWKIASRERLDANKDVQEALLNDQLEAQMSKEFHQETTKIIRRICESRWRMAYPPTLQTLTQKVRKELQSQAPHDAPVTMKITDITIALIPKAR